MAENSRKPAPRIRAISRTTRTTRIGLFLGTGSRRSLDGKREECFGIAEVEWIDPDN